MLRFVSRFGKGATELIQNVAGIRALDKISYI
jgi:hypothetical protein